MRTVATVAIGGVALCCMLCACTLAQAAAQQRSPLADLVAVHAAALASPAETFQPLEGALGHEADRRADLIAGIRAMLGDEDPRVRAAGAYLAGLHRAEECVDLLRRQVGETLPFRMVKELPVLGDTPAADALIRIGTRKASLAAVQVLRFSAAEPEQTQALRVLLAIEGPRCADLLLAEELARITAGSPEAARLSAARAKVQEGMPGK